MSVVLARLSWCSRRLTLQTSRASRPSWFGTQWGQGQQCECRRQVNLVADMLHMCPADRGTAEQVGNLFILYFCPAPLRELSNPSQLPQQICRGPSQDLVCAWLDLGLASRGEFNGLTRGAPFQHRPHVHPCPWPSC